MSAVGGSLWPQGRLLVKRVLLDNFVPWPGVSWLGTLVEDRSKGAAGRGSLMEFGRGLPAKLAGVQNCASVDGRWERGGLCEDVATNLYSGQVFLYNLSGAGSKIAYNCNIARYYLGSGIVSPLTYIFPYFDASAFTGAPMNSRYVPKHLAVIASSTR